MPKTLHPSKMVPDIVHVALVDLMQCAKGFSYLKWILPAKPREDLLFKVEAKTRPDLLQNDCIKNPKDIRAVTISAFVCRFYTT